MSKTPEDLTSPAGADGVRIDAPAPPSGASVSSGPGGPTAPPRRPRRQESAGPASVSAQVPADSVAAPPAAPPPESVAEVAPTELGFELDDEPRPKRVRRQRAQRPATTTRPVMAPQQQRQYRQTLVKVDLWSVTKLSLCFYLSAMFVTLVALIALWVIADAAGIIKDVEKFIGDLLSAKKDSFKFLSGEVLRGTILIGLVIVAIQVIVTVVAASFYNIFAELFGGIEFTVREEEAPRA